MFIKKDLRKIPRILSDAAPMEEHEEHGGVDVKHITTDDDHRASKRVKREELTELRLQRRQAEFNGSINILCQPQNAPSLQNLVSLSLYDCQIHTLDGIGLLGMMNQDDDTKPAVCPHLAELNLGRNPLKTLPDEVSALSPSLKELWLDDCQLSGELPACLMKLEHLEVLRVSNNKITSIPPDVSKLEYLRVLCLDRNEIENVPTELSELSSLESLLLRGNKLPVLPEGVPGNTMTCLSSLHVSSNLLETLPASLVECTSLQTVYANSNRISRLPTKNIDDWNKLDNLQRMTLTHNRIESLPPSFVERFGDPDPETGECTKDAICVVTVAYNPIVDRQKKDLPSISNGKSSELEMESSISIAATS